MTVSLPFRNREDAARQLAIALAKFRGSRPVILAIPRGAVPMGRILADALDAELDVVLVRKLGAPGNPEFAIGAVDERGAVMLGEYVEASGADRAYVEQEARRQLELIRARRASYRPGQAPVALAGRTVIVVDDGLATGSTMIAALKAARAQAPAHLVCAVPVAAGDSLSDVARFADEVVCLATPWPFGAVGYFYRDFSGVSDEDVVALLAGSPLAASRAQGAAALAVRIPADGIDLEGDLVLPDSPGGLVLFAHGSGSSRHSSRNRYVAQVLNERGLATLLFDLLSPEEDRDASKRFDIELLAQRLDAALQWARQETSLRGLGVGLFGASTGAAAAIQVAAGRPGEISALVSRGGRPDLAGTHALSRLEAHALLIVGGADTDVLALNREARAATHNRAELVVVPGATHLFEEPGTLEQAAQLAAEWFVRWL